MSKSVLLFIGLLSTFSCQRSENSAEEIWQLGWRMTDASYNDPKLAEQQFDSLLRYDVKKISENFLVVGLTVKLINGKKEEMDEIFSRLSNQQQIELCKTEVSAQLGRCKDIKVAKEKVTNQSLQMELLRMQVKDQLIRGNASNRIINKYGLERPEITQEIDVANQQRLKEIINTTGFPNKEQVGKDAMQGVFLIIQHADNDTVWQKSQLTNIEIAVQNGDLDGEDYALLYDRIQVNSGRPQRYGTQFSDLNQAAGTITLKEVEDPNNLDKRRRSVGLMPIALYEKWMLKY